MPLVGYQGRFLGGMGRTPPDFRPVRFIRSVVCIGRVWTAARNRWHAGGPGTELVAMTMLTHAADGRTVGPDRAPAELLDVGAVAGLLDCSVRHVYRLSDAGKMPPPLKLGALVRWRRAALKEWLDQGCPPIRTARGGAR